MYLQQSSLPVAHVNDADLDADLEQDKRSFVLVEKETHLTSFAKISC